MSKVVCDKTCEIIATSANQIVPQNSVGRYTCNGMFTRTTFLLGGLKRGLGTRLIIIMHGV